MRFDDEERYARYERLGGPEEPAAAGYEREYARRRRRVYHGYGMGYLGGALRSRGSYQAGQLRSGLNPRDEFEFEWGEGYVGGRGYGGTNYDYEHGYRLGTQRVPTPGTGPGREAGAEAGGRGAAEWRRRGQWEPYGPARYGYGPYYQRLLRRRRSDEEIREDVEETLFYDTWVDADRIEVLVEDGVVTLRGTLPSHEEVRYAVDDAWDVDGVRGVRSELVVEPPSRGPEQGGRERTAAGAAGAQAAAKARAGEGEAASSVTGARAGAGRPQAAGEAGSGAEAGGAGRSGRGRQGRSSEAES